MGILGRVLVRLWKENAQLIKIRGKKPRDHFFMSLSLTKCSQQFEFIGEFQNRKGADELFVHIL